MSLAIIGSSKIKSLKKTEILPSLPGIGEEGVLYLIPSSNPATNNGYNEYIWVVSEENPQGAMELLGSPEGYITPEERQKLQGISEGANNYKLPLATTAILGGVKSSTTGTTADRNYKVQVNGDGTMKVNVPWENTTYEEATSEKEGLMSSSDKEKLDSILPYVLAYGIEWDSSASSLTPIRIGNLDLHRTLPIQSKFKGCVCQGKDIMYYLNPDDWSKKEDGTASRLDGYDGTVQVEIPEFYIWSEVDGTKRRVWVSLYKCVSNAVKIPHMLVDAYRSTTLNQVPEDMGYLSTLPVNSAISVVNSSTYCRGAMNVNDTIMDSFIDTDPCRSYLNKPRTNVTRANFRTYARNANRELLCYDYYKAIFWWLYVIEYANFNSQAAFNGELTSDGYKQGGLGTGMTDWNNMEEWMPYINFDNNPITPNGFGNSLGNNTGITEMPAKEFTITSRNMYINQWSNSNSTVTKDNKNHSVTITNITSSTSQFLNSNRSYFAVGLYTFNISGLAEGQSIRFVRGSTDLKVVSSDGEVQVDIPATDNRVAFRMIANFTGACNITISTPTIPSNITLTRTTSDHQVPRWRGFDNPFGDTWTNLDGVVISRTAANQPSNVYATSDPDLFNDTGEGMRIAGIEVAQDGNIKDFDLGETAEMIPSAVGNPNIGDYHYCNAATLLRTLIINGIPIYGSRSGLACFSSTVAIASCTSSIGFRTLVTL